MTKGRLEAFSDGVFAIAITLLVLDLTVPKGHPDGGLWGALGREWPSFFAYLVSFLVIGSDCGSGVSKKSRISRSLASISVAYSSR